MKTTWVLRLVATLAVLAASGCAGDERRTKRATTAAPPRDYLEQPVSNCRGWAAEREYGPVTLRPVDEDSPERGYPGTLCDVDGVEDRHRASFVPRGWCGNEAAVDVRVPSPNADPIVTVRPVGPRPDSCTLGGTLQFASVVVFLTTDRPDDVRIEYPDPTRAARIDAERASGELSTITMAIDDCAARLDRDQFDPPDACLDLAHLRTTDERMRGVRSAASIERAADSYDITVPFRLNGRPMAIRETYTKDGMGLEHGEIPLG